MNDLYTIGITTKDRWSHVESTLQRLIEYGLQDAPLMVVDDGSNTQFDQSLLAPFAKATFLRREISKNIIASRNEMIYNCQTKYFLSIDDDSYPIKGSVEEMLAYAESTPDLFCLGFPVEDPEGNMQVASLQSTPYQCQTFIGCGHILRVDHFKALGGYREEFVRQGEESDISYRALLRGLKVIHYPHLLIKHFYTQTSRNHDLIHYFGARNKVIWNRLYLPFSARWYANAKGFVERSILAFKNRSGRHFAGFYDGMTCDLRKWKHREISAATIGKWKSLPFC